MPRVVLAPDKFRGTADATDVAAAMATAATGLGWHVTPLPMSDGGEGFLDAASVRCPSLVTTTVTGPDGRAVAARWRYGDGIAVVESAQASGLTLAGGVGRNDPLAATSRGTGELVVVAARQVGDAGTVIVGLGGSATTDGGLGAVEAVEEAGGLGGTTLIAACDVDVGFLDAARRFGPQKGADADQVVVLGERLEHLAEVYRDRYGVDVVSSAGAGAAGGLGGGLSVVGATLVSGFEVVSELVGLAGALDGADRVVTGEGSLDASSFTGKLVGGVIAAARARGIATLVVAGRSTADGEERARAAGCRVVSLTDRFGARSAMDRTVACVTEVTAEWLGSSPD